MNPQTNNQQPIDPQAQAQPQPQAYTPQSIAAPSAVPNVAQPVPVYDPQFIPSTGQPMASQPGQANSPVYPNQGVGKSYVATVLFTWILGFLGVDGFYLGYYGSGLIRLLVGGVGSITARLLLTNLTITSTTSTSRPRLIAIYSPILVVGVWNFVNLWRTVSGKRTDKQGQQLVGREQHRVIGQVAKVLLGLGLLIALIGFAGLASSSKSVTSNSSSSATGSSGNEVSGESPVTVEFFDLSNIGRDLVAVDGDASAYPINVSTLTTDCNKVGSDYAVAQKQASKLSGDQQQAAAKALNQVVQINKDCTNLEQNPASETAYDALSNDIETFFGDDYSSSL